MATISTDGEERRSRSLFGPIVLVAIGAYFLLNKLGLVEGLHWWSVLRFWPLFLVFLGLNIIAQQAPRPFGPLLSAVVALAAVTVFGYLLFFGADGIRGNRWGLFSGDFQTEAISFPAGDLARAAVHITTVPPGVDVEALDGRDELIAGTVTYQGDLVFETDRRGDEATVTLKSEGSDGWFFNPANWGEPREGERWQIGLNRHVPLELTLDVNAGIGDVDLSQLQLAALALTTNAGGAEVMLPGGNYDGQVTVNAGSLTLTLPGQGRQSFDMSVNAGSLSLVLPTSIEARIEGHSSLGDLNIDDDRFELVSDEDGREVWQTAGYQGATDRIDLSIEISAGSANVK
jgi:hypothetical protein